MHRTTRSASPVIEPVEGRQLFSVAIAFVAPDTLTFTGNNAADTININDNGMGVIQGSRTNAAGVVAPFGPVFNIRNIVVNSGGGNDKVNYRFTGDLLGGPLSLRRVNANLGDGEDAFNLDATADIDLAATARVEVNVHGGPGDGRDQLTARYRGEMDGGWKLWMNGGDANDKLLADVLFDQGSAGQFGARLIGGDHDDTIGLFVRKANAADPILINAGASGGNHTDTITRTPLATNDATCEVVNIVP